MDRLILNILSVDLLLYCNTPGTSSLNKQFSMDGNGDFQTISYMKIWFIIQLIANQLKTDGGYQAPGGDGQL